MVNVIPNSLELFFLCKLISFGMAPERMGSNYVK